MIRATQFAAGATTVRSLARNSSPSAASTLKSFGILSHNASPRSFHIACTLAPPSLQQHVPAQPSRYRLQSTSATTTAHGPSEVRARLGIGGAKLSKSNLDQYASVIATSLRSGVATFESGHGGEARLSNAYQAAMTHLREEDPEEIGNVREVTLTARFGYRTVGDAIGGGGEGEVADDYVGRYPNDVQVEEAAGSSAADGNADGKDSKAPGGQLDEQSDHDGPSTTTNEKGSDLTTPTEEETSGFVVHNLSREYVAHSLSSSPLVQLRTEQRLGGSQPAINLVHMAHNPEAQGAKLAGSGAPLDEIRAVVKERLTDAFIGLETGKAEGLISSYGVCSNGLSLPTSHPLHLPWMDVLVAASDAVGYVHGAETIDGTPPDDVVAGISTLQLPANLLETNGLSVAEDVKMYLDTGEGDDGDETPPRLPNLPSTVDIYVTRPLTCYPDQGTGSGHPFKLVDYLIDTTTTSDLASGMTKVWTNTIEGSRPPHYGPALAATMGHFDATEILEAGQERKLTVEERETLDGCRLLQSMIHDLDANLDDIRSFSAYEDDLYAKVVPLIHDTFEELDEDSAQVLQSFFVAHGGAVRHAIAKTTRKLLQEGGDGVKSYDVPEGLTLQEFALQHLLKQKQVDKVIVGCPKPEHVLEAIHSADKLSK
mmetsp:Transcript_2164/g.4965  ORF Transcript_2164/g.4965 Transcript_2164/m.4965 type:complete len:655 (-) Transcript_2164:877-2841(-)